MDLNLTIHLAIAAAFLPEVHKSHVASAQGVKGEMAAFYDAPSDLWTPGYDQFDISCWQNTVTRKVRYFDTPPRQPLALPPPAFTGDPYRSHLPIGRPFQHAARPPADRFPSWLGKKVQFQTPALNVTEPAAAKGWTAAAAIETRPPLPFSPNNFARSLPPSWPWAPPSPKKCKNEADQWFLQRKGKGGEYCLNTSTWKWQIETPDCLKKYPTRR